MSSTDGWLDDDADLFDETEEERRRRPQPRPPTTGQRGRPLVYWVPVACPRCGGRKPRTTGHYHSTRYHKCQKCQLVFDSEELDPTPNLTARPPT